MEPILNNDAVIFGILVMIIAVVFRTAENPTLKEKFYKYVPIPLLCYFIPSLLNVPWFQGTDLGFRLVSADDSNLYFVASRYFLPASLVLLTLNIDFPAIRSLGTKAIIMFLTGTVGIIIGAPLAFLIVAWLSPATVEGEVWRGLTTIAGSWIGGSANQTAMKEVFQVDGEMFSAMIAVDILVANFWMAFLLYGAGISKRVDSWFKADSSAIDKVLHRIENYQANIARIPSFTDLVLIAGLAFGCVGLAHFCADLIAPWIATNAPYLKEFSLTSPFFWIVVVSTTLGVSLSFTPLRKLEGAGTTKIGSLFVYLLIAVIGLQMNLLAITEKTGLFAIGLIWISIHVLLLIIVGRLIRAPFFFVAVGSQANVGGAASAPIVASAFHPSLAPVGVLLAVLGYAVGTYGAYLCGLLLQAVA